MAVDPGRCLTITISLVIKLIGLLSLLCGFWIMFSPAVDLYLNLLPIPSIIWTVSLMVIGVYLVITGILGILSGSSNRRCYTATYMLMLFVLLILESVSTITTLIYQIDILHFVKDSLLDRLKSEYGEKSSFTRTVDHLQYKFRCCGVLSPGDYNSSKWRERHDFNFPLTCCHLINKESLDAWETPQPEDIYSCQNDFKSRNSGRFEQGCILSLVDYVFHILMSFLPAFLAFIFLQVVGILAGFSTCRRIDRQQVIEKFTNS